MIMASASASSRAILCKQKRGQRADQSQSKRKFPLCLRAHTVHQSRVFNAFSDSMKLNNDDCTADRNSSNREHRTMSQISVGKERLRQRMNGRSRDIASSAKTSDQELALGDQGGFTLYGSQGSRSPLVNWYLYERGIEFEVKEPRDVSNPHPFGQVPALRHGKDVELFESGAILLYLADKSGETSKSEKIKAQAFSWVLWANASLDPICFKEDQNGRVIDTGIKNETKGMRRLDDVLSKRTWLSGDEFGVADVAVASYLLYVPQFFQGVSFKRWPNVAKYMGRCASREAYGKAFGPRVQSYLISELMKDVEGK